MSPLPGLTNSNDNFPASPNSPDICRTVSKDNIVADALSHPSLPLIASPSLPTPGDESDDIIDALTAAPLSVPPAPSLSYHQMAQLQSTCPSIPPLLALPSLQIASFGAKPAASW